MKKQWWWYLAIGLVVIAIVVVVVVILAKVAPSKKDAYKNYTFTAEQENYLKQLHPVAENRFRQLIYEIETKTGWKVDIESGYRTWAEQADLYQLNNRNARPGYSFHNYGFALDINLVKNGTRIRKADSDAAWEQTGAVSIAKALGFRWGGDFSGYQDPVHFDLSKEHDIQDLHSKAIAQFGSNPPDIQGNRIRI